MVCFVEKVLAKAKRMVATMSRNRIYMQLMRWLSMYTLEGSSFSLGGGGRRMEFFNSCIPNDVPHVPMTFPKGVPNITSYYPISFAQSSPLLTYIGEPKGRLFIPTFVILGSLPIFNFLWMMDQRKIQILGGNPYNERLMFWFFSSWI